MSLLPDIATGWLDIVRLHEPLERWADQFGLREARWQWVQVAPCDPCPLLDQDAYRLGGIVLRHIGCVGDGHYYAGVCWSLSVLYWMVVTA